MLSRIKPVALAATILNVLGAVGLLGGVLWIRALNVDTWERMSNGPWEMGQALVLFQDAVLMAIAFVFALMAAVAISFGVRLSRAQSVDALIRAVASVQLGVGAVLMLSSVFLGVVVSRGFEGRFSSMHALGPPMPPVSSFVGLAMIPYLLVGALAVIAGAGLLKMKEWGRVLTLVTSACLVFSFPAGTTIGALCFWVLLSREASSRFTEAAEQSVDVTALTSRDAAL